MASLARMAASFATMTRNTLAKAILLGLNVMFVVMGFTMFILAAQFSQYTEQLGSIIKDGSVTLSLFSQPNTVLTMVGVVLILIGSQGAVGACFTSKRLLLAYHFSLLVLLTVLIYVTGMMFIYREDAGTLVHTYWNDFNDKMTMLDTDWVAFVDEEAQDHISTRVRREMKRAGMALVVTGVFLLLALTCTMDVLGWRYSVRRIGPTVNLCVFIFSVVLLTLSYLVATSSYDVPDSISALVTVSYKINAETSSRAVAFQKTLRETPADFFQSAATEKQDNSVVFSPTLPSPPPPQKVTAHPGSSNKEKEKAEAVAPPPTGHAAEHLPPPAAKHSPPPAAKLSPPPSLPVYAPNHDKTDLSELMALPVQEWYTDSDTDSTEMVGFELGGKQLTFWPTKRNDQAFTPWDYRVTCVKEHAVMEAPSSANPESNWHVVSPHLGDDQMVAVDLQHAVHFAGQSYLKIYVGSNGFITFDDHRFAMQLSLQAHYKRVMASVLFSDLNPEEGGVVRYTETAEFLLVSWEDVPEYAEDGKPAPKHSFQIKLWKDGHLDMRWPKYTPSQNAVIVGVSGGKEPAKHGAGVSTLNLLQLADPTLNSVCSGNHHPDVTQGMVDPTNAPSKASTTPAPTAAPKAPTAGLEIQHEAPVMEFYMWGGSDSDTDTDSNATPNATNRFSLTGRTVTFAPTALHRDPYLWDYAVSCVGESHSMEKPTTTWHELSNLKDDGTERIDLEWPVPFNGRTYAAVYVGANGFVNLETPRSPNMVSMRAHYSELRISPLFTDLNPEVGGKVRWTQTDEKLLVEWKDVPEYSEVTAGHVVPKHSFQMAIRRDGHIDMRWPRNDESRLDALVGVSTKIMGWRTHNLTHLDTADAKCDATLSLQTKPADVMAPGQMPPNFENRAEPTQEFGEPQGTDSDATMGPINGLDLEGKKLVFYPSNYSSSNYNFSRWSYDRVCDSRVTQLEQPPAGHAWKLVAHPMDDGNAKVRPKNPVTFDGVAYDYMRIGSNGWISFNDANVGMMPTLDNHFTRVGVSALFTDLNPDANGTIRWAEADDFVLVSWENVPAYDPSQLPHNPPNAHVPVFTFQCKLWKDGRIQLSYLKAPASRMYTVVGLSTGLRPVEYESTKLLLINGGDCASDPTLTTIPVADLPPSKSWSDYDYGPYDYSDYGSTRRHLLGLETTDMTKWKWPATAVWVQNVGSTTFNHELFIVAFTITFSGTNISMYEKHHHTFQDRLQAQIAAGAAVELRAVEVALLDRNGTSHMSINGAWAAQMLSVSAFTACVVSCFGLLGSFSEMDRKFLLWHTLATALVAAFVTLSSFLAIGHANSTENMMNRRWDKIDNGEEHLSVVESTQLVDNNMRMVGLLGCACVFLLVVAAVLSSLALFVLPPPRRHRLRRDHKESGSDTEEDEGGELLAKSKKGNKGKEAGGSSAVAVEMQQLQDLLERTAGAAMGKPEAASNAARKKFYGDNVDGDGLSDDEDAPVDASLAQAIGAGLSTVMAKVSKGGAAGKKSKQKAKLDRDAVELPTMTPQDTNKLVAHYLGQGSGSASSPSKPASSTFTLDD